MPTGTVSVTIENVHREFGSVTALDGIDLSIDGPGIIGVAGPNGAGKTTLIHCLLGLVRPTDGTTRINGTPSRAFDATDRGRIGYMPQHEAIYRDLTVRENVDFFARLYRLDNRSAAVERALELVDLHDRADARIGELSGGMIRRTSLACALVHDPDILMLDEPTVGLDPELRATMWDRFQQRRKNGALVLVSTHYLGEARNCDRVLFLRNGRVLAFDTPDAFLKTTDTADLEAAFLTLLDNDEDGRGDATDSSGLDTENSRNSTDVEVNR